MGASLAVCQDPLVRDLFDQARTKHRGGNPEDDVAACELLLEVRLRELASPARPPTAMVNRSWTPPSGVPSGS